MSLRRSFKGYFILRNDKAQALQVIKNYIRELQGVGTKSRLMLFGSSAAVSAVSPVV